jgi:hypothetical protein
MHVTVTERGLMKTEAKRRGLFGKLLLFVVGALLLTATVAAFFMYPTFIRPPQPKYPPAASVAEANLQDLEYASQVIGVSRSFTAEERSAAMAIIDELIDRVETLDPAALEMGIARAVAQADDGHTNVRGAAWGLTLNSVPIRMIWFREGLFVIKAAPGLSDLLGAQIISVGEHTPESAAEALRIYVGGHPALAREMSPNLLASPAALHAAGFLPSADEGVFRFRLPDGSEIDRTIPSEAAPVNGPPPSGLSPSETLRRDMRDKQWARRILSPAPRIGDDRVWTHVLGENAQLPLYLTRPDEPYWHMYLPERAMLYLQMNRAANAQGHPPLADYLETVVEEASNKRPQNAVIDLRFNTGGDYTATAKFTEQLPRVVPGEIFIITSGSTFSAGLVTAARLKYFAEERGHIVGEHAGDREVFWAEGGRVMLPNSGIRVGYATAYHDWRNGCGLSDLLICYPINYILGKPAGDIAPDIPAQISFADYLAGKDTVLEAIDAHLDVQGEAAGLRSTAAGGTTAAVARRFAGAGPSSAARRSVG